MTVKSLLIGLPMMLLCLTMQVAATYWCVRHYLVRSASHGPDTGFFTSIAPLLVAMLIMLIGDTFELVAWGVLFVALGEFSSLHDAVYHSAVNFASLGYGDIVMSAPWRLLGPLEAINGVLMLGMTSAAAVVILQHMIKQRHH